MKANLSKTVSIALLALMATSMLAGVPFAHAGYNNTFDSMWITATNSKTGPNTIDGSTIGLNNWFLVYVWLNTTNNPGVNSGINAWQFYLIFKTGMINATDVEYTGVGKSKWSLGFFVTPVVYSYGHKNATYDYVLFSEVLNNKKELINEDSVAYVNFTILQVPGKYQTLTSDIRLDNPGAFKTQLKDAQTPVDTYIPTCGHAVYTWVWVAPAAAAFALSPGAQTFGGTALPIPTGTEFTESVQLTIDAAWGCIAANFYLTNDNTSLIYITKIVMGSLWGIGVFDNTTTPGQVLGSLSAPSGTPSGTVVLANITYVVWGGGAIPPQPIDPLQWWAHLTLDNSTGNVWAEDAPGPARIPATIPGAYLILVKGLVTKFPGALQVSSAIFGPMPVVGTLFNITVKLINLHNYWCLIGLDFRLTWNTTVIQFQNVSWEGPFLPHYAVPPSLGTWWYDQWQPAYPPYPIHDLVGDLILPDGSGRWPTVVSAYPDSNATDSTVAILEFKVIYQPVGTNVVSYLNIVDEHWVGIDPTTLNDHQTIVYVPFTSPRNGTVTIKGLETYRQLDLFGGAVNSGWGPLVGWPYPQFPAPYGGQGYYQPMDLVEDQSQVYANALVTYNGWPVQHKLVTFEVEDNQENMYTRITAFTDANGIASVSFRMPWPCVNPESLFGVWELSATCQLADIVVGDEMPFKYDYIVHILDVSTDKYEYEHMNGPVKVTITYGTRAMQWYPCTFCISLVDELGVVVGFTEYSVMVGGAVWCQLKTTTVTIYVDPNGIPKWAFKGLAYVHVNAIDTNDWFDTEHEAAITPEFIYGPIDIDD
jgi:hypothetical protein